MPLSDTQNLVVMPHTIPSDVFRVGAILASPSQNMLFALPDAAQRFDPVRIEPRAMDVLLILARADGEVVPRDVILEHAWPETMVTDDALNRIISSLRKTLKESFEENGVIVTIPKRGYRLAATVDMSVGQAIRGDSIPQSVPEARIATHSPGIGARQKKTGLSAFQTILAALAGVTLLVLVWSFAIQEPEETLRFPMAVTFDERVERMPAISPDESRVAFSRTHQDGSMRLVVRLLDGDSELEMTDGAGFDMHPDWSADGAQIVFWRFNDGCSIHVIPSLGGTERRLTDCNGIYPDVRWGADDESIVFNSRETDSGPFSIHVLDLDNGAMRSVTRPDSTSWGDHDPIMTPDGSRITFTRSFSEGMQDQFVVDLGTGEESRLTRDGRLIRGASLMPDGNSVVIASNRGGTFGLWDVPLDGGDPKPVAVADSRIRYIDIGPEGRAVYERFLSDVGLVMAPVDGKESSSIVNGEGSWNMHPAVRPGSRDLAWVSNRSGSFEVWQKAGMDGVPVRMTQFGSGFVSRPAWSPSGDTLVFVARVEGNPELYLMEVGGVPVRLTSTESSELAPAFSADGRHILFTTEKDGQWMVRRFNIESGAIEDVIPFAMGIRVIPGGIGFVYARTDRDGLYFRRSEDADEELLDAAFVHSDWGHLDLSGSDVIYYARQEQAVKRWHSATGKTTLLLREIDAVPTWDPGLAVWADSVVILAREGNQTGDLYVIEGLE